MNNYLDKIIKIQEERKILLEMTKKSLIEKQNNVTNNINQLQLVLEYDDKNIKKYQNILKAQELIISLSQNIVKCQNKDDIENLRKKLNSCLNKVKNEIKKRNLGEEKYNEYYEKVSFLRKDIAKYLRFIKREENLFQLIDLGTKKDLSDEEKINLKKMIRLEDSYNKRYLNSKKENIKPVKKKIKNRVKIDDYRKNSVKKREFCSIENYRKINKNNISPIELSIKRGTPKTFVEQNEKKKEENDYLLSLINEYKSMYNIQDTFNYDRKISDNILSFMRNIPLYSSNKRKIKKMEKDCLKHNGKGDFIGFIEYTRSNNSLVNGLKSIFSKSKLFNHDKIYYYNHHECVEWIKSFCSTNNIDINYQNSKQLVK